MTTTRECLDWRGSCVCVARVTVWTVAAFAFAPTWCSFPGTTIPDASVANLLQVLLAMPSVATGVPCCHRRPLLSGMPHRWHHNAFRRRAARLSPCRYTFRYDGELYTSKTNSRRRESDGTCADTTQLSPTFEAGSTVTCWQAVVEPIPSEYECGNAQCFKVFDPATDAESAAATALGMQIGGGVLLTIGLSLGGCAYYALRKAKQAAGGGGGTEMVSTSGTSGAYPSPAPAGGAYPSPAHVPVAGAYPPMAAPFGAAPAAAPAAPAGGGGTLRLHLAGAKGIRKGNNPKATFFVGGVKYETPICPGGGLTDVAWSEGMQNVTVTAQQLSTETVAVNVSASNGDNLASATFPLSSFGSGAPVDQWVAMDHGQLHVVGQLTGAATAPAAAPASVAGYGYPPAGAAAAPGGSYGVPPAAVGGGYPPAASMPTGYAPPTGYPAATAPGYPAAAAPAYAPQGYAPQGGGGL